MLVMITAIKRFAVMKCPKNRNVRMYARENPTEFPPSTSISMNFHQLSAVTRVKSDKTTEDRFPHCSITISFIASYLEEIWVMCTA